MTTLQKFGDSLDADKRQDLLNSIEEEAQRLGALHRQSARHVEDRGGRAEAEGRFRRRAGSRSARRSSGRARPFRSRAFSQNLARDLPFVRGDAGLIEQVLFNLLDNAQKYGGGGPVTVHARGVGAEVLITVTDEGPGIKPADLERIFEKFYQGGRSDGRKTGVGLGLSIAKGLVEAMGGRIWAESPAVRRRGTRVLVALPVAKDIPRDAA